MVCTILSIKIYKAFPILFVKFEIGALLLKKNGLKIKKKERYVKPLKDCTENDLLRSSHKGCTRRGAWHSLKSRRFCQKILLFL